MSEFRKVEVVAVVKTDWSGLNAFTTLEMAMKYCLKCDDRVYTWLEFREKFILPSTNLDAARRAIDDLLVSLAKDAKGEVVGGRTGLETLGGIVKNIVPYIIVREEQ